MPSGGWDLRCAYRAILDGLGDGKAVDAWESKMSLSNLRWAWRVSESFSHPLLLKSPVSLQFKSIFTQKASHNDVEVILGEATIGHSPSHSSSACMDDRER